jgi:response regulator of citrate/malate metabolism
LPKNSWRRKSTSREQRDREERPERPSKYKDPATFTEIRDALAKRSLSADDLLARIDIARSTLYLYISNLLDTGEIRKRNKSTTKRQRGRIVVLFELTPIGRSFLKEE